MTHTHRWTLPLLGVLLLISCRLTADLTADSAPTQVLPDPMLEPTEEPSTIAPKATLRYSDLRTSDPNLLSLDIYPSGQANSPVMIYLHGGGWQGGDKINVYLKPAAFNAQGFVFVSVNYRLRPKVTIGDEAGDVARAVAWVKKNISAYGGDPEQMWLMGHSAGAHLVSLVGTDESFLQAEGVNFSDLRGIISLDAPVYDLPLILKTSQSPNAKNLAVAFGNSPQSWRDLSPAWHVESNKGIPPFFIVYSGWSTSLGRLAEAFKDQLMAASVPVRILAATDKDHTQISHEIGLEESYVHQAVFDFVMP